MNRPMILLAVVAVLGILIGAFGIGDTIKIMGDDITDLNATTIGELKTGELAQGDLFQAFDEVAVEKTTRSYGGIPTGSSETPYYLVHVGDHFAVLSCGNKDIQSKIEKLMDETWDLWESEDMPSSTVFVTTKVIAMPEKVFGYTQDYCEEWGMTASEFDSLVETDYVLNVVQYNTMKIIPFIGFGVGILCAVIFVVILVKRKKA